MSLNNITRRMLAATLTILGYGACTTDQPELYGSYPVLYGPMVPDTVEMNAEKEDSIGQADADNTHVVPDNQPNDQESK